MAAKSDTAVLLRIHYWDDELAAFARDLSTRLPYDLTILADESQGAAPPLPHPTLGLAKDFSARHGLPDNFPQVTWRCGDYFLYLAREKLPGYRFYWMAEHDVRLHFRDPLMCFAPFEAEDADLIACAYGPADPAWEWGNTMGGLDPVHRCAYSLVRLSAAAIDRMLIERQALARTFARERRDPTSWPNDEAFTATILTARGMACRDFNDFGRTLYDGESFDFWRPEALSALRAKPFDDRIHHPVLHGLHLFNKWTSIAFCTKNFDFDWLAGYVRELVGQEWSTDEAGPLLDHVETMRAERRRQMSAIER